VQFVTFLVFFVVKHADRLGAARQSTVEVSTIRMPSNTLGLVPAAVRALVAHEREGFFKEVNVIGGSSSNSSRDGTDPLGAS